MVQASLKAYMITKDRKYIESSVSIASWMFGRNVTGKSIYSVQTGVCFDGIDGVDRINLNSGAESTIEALLTLLSIEKNKIAISFLRKIL